MTVKIKQGTPAKLFKEVSPIVSECFEGVWSEKDLKELIGIPHDSKIFFVAYKDDKPVGYAFVVANYVDAVDAKIASVQELGVLPQYRETEVVDELLDKAIQFSKTNKVELLEQVVSSIDQWIIPNLVNKNLKPSEIKADREISSSNEAKLILTNLKKSDKINVIMNQLFFESDNKLESQMIEEESDLDGIERNGLIAFGSVISVEKTEELESTLNELSSIDIEWDEIGITFDYYI